MVLVQRVIGGVGILLVACVLLGLVVRRRYPDWYFFSLYLLSVVSLEWVFPLKPDWYSPNFYQFKEVLYNVLRFAMALEIGLRIFRSFPGALASARRLIFLVLIGTLAAILLVDVRDYQTFVRDVQPRILNGAVWIFSGLAGLILWYRLPLKPFYKGVVLSYVPYLLVSTALSTTLAQRGFKNSDILQYFSQLAYVALLLYWNRVIWKRQPPAQPLQDSASLPGAA
jgi:hypothetical protein